MAGLQNHLNPWCLAGLFLVVAVSAPSALSQGRDDSKKQDSSATVAMVRDGQTDPGARSKGGADYVIGPDDMLDVSVWKEQELSRTLQVRPDGKISLPLINDVQAAGLTPEQLTQSIGEKLKKFLTAPRVTVIVTQINSQRVYVMGEVQRPGTYPILPGMTVLQAISSAGGLTQYANMKKILVLRTDHQAQNKIAFNYKDVVDGRHPEQNIPVKPGDTVVVP
jgi:polysaccharide export outer membrane protein